MSGLRTAASRAGISEIAGIFPRDFGDPCHASSDQTRPGHSQLFALNNLEFGVPVAARWHLITCHPFYYAGPASPLRDFPRTRQLSSRRAAIRPAKGRKKYEDS